MSCSRLVFASFVALALATACDNNTNVGPLVPFSRPEHVAFGCFAQKVGTTGKSAVFDVMPQLCCTNNLDVANFGLCGLTFVPGKKPSDPKVPAPGTHQPAHLHALVTQSTRGEVAAVDMNVAAAERVLDSDSQIPGYTFIDSGGLPSAVVMPPKQPRLSGATKGPEYAFVASAEEYQVRAIPACRFRTGYTCGPEVDARKAGQEVTSSRLMLSLPGAPGDMILGPDEALWVTLPELALIARVELADPAETPYDAFALDSATGLPKVPQFFRVPDAPVGAPPLPVAETPSYAEVCGLGRPYQLDAVTLPIAPRAAMAPIRPTLLRYDAATGVLLVADASAPAIHAFTLGADGTLTARGALPTGAPIRDLALTAAVPVEVPRDANGAPDALSAAATAALPSARYLYAIDDRDGSVMVFGYEVAGGAPRLTPLLAPDANQRFADRIHLTQPANALDVVDTRAHSDLACNGPFEVSTQGARRPDESQQDYDNRIKAASDAFEPDVMEPIRKAAGPTVLRGVFVAVASENGTVSMLDVHDLDLDCRAAKDCAYAPPGGTRLGLTPLRPDVRAAVTVRRHTVRRISAGPLAGATTNDTLFSSVNEESCAPFAPIAPSAKLCGPTDPWAMVPDTYSVQYRASIPGASSTSGVLYDSAEPPLELAPDELVLAAPNGLDFCGRGVQVGDFVAVSEIVTTAHAQQNDPCANVGGEDDKNLLEVTRAFRDRLVLRPRADDKRTARDVRAQLVACFQDQDFVKFDVRARDFLVLGTSYFSNVVADAQGACVIDTTRPQLTSRAIPGQRYDNPYLSFQLVDDAAELPGRSATITLGQGSSPLSSTLVTGRFTDVQPATLRYYPGLDVFFVVDSASQGLTRFALNPFRRDD